MKCDFCDREEPWKEIWWSWNPWYPSESTDDSKRVVCSKRCKARLREFEWKNHRMPNNLEKALVTMTWTYPQVPFELIQKIKNLETENQELMSQLYDQAFSCTG